MKALLTFFLNPFKLKLLWVLGNHLINKYMEFIGRFLSDVTYRIYYFSSLGSNYVLKLKGAKIPKIMLWVILSLSTENGPRAEKYI